MKTVSKCLLVSTLAFGKALAIHQDAGSSQVGQSLIDDGIISFHDDLDSLPDINDDGED